MATAISSSPYLPPSGTEGMRGLLAFCWWHPHKHSRWSELPSDTMSAPVWCKQEWYSDDWSIAMQRQRGFGAVQEAGQGYAGLGLNSAAAFFAVLEVSLLFVYLFVSRNTCFWEASLYWVETEERERQQCRSTPQMHTALCQAQTTTENLREYSRHESAYLCLTIITSKINH